VGKKIDAEGRLSASGKPGERIRSNRWKTRLLLWRDRSCIVNYHDWLMSTPRNMCGGRNSDHRFAVRSSTMPAMSNLTSVLNQLEQERTRLAFQIESLTNALSALNGTGNKRTGKRTMSAAGRARIAAAQRARWAKAKGQKVVPITARKRTMSASARRRIAAAQKARWAKWRKTQRG
jgi:hypothetical protein